MKKLVIFSVKLQNLRDFSSFPGAREFQSKYSAHQRDYSYYAFDLEKDAPGEVEKELQALGLDYSKHFEVALEKEEISSYPVFYLTIPALYDLVTDEEGDASISPEVGSMPMAQDFRTEAVVARSDVVEILTRLNPEIVPEERVFNVKKKKYQIVRALPQLESPILMLHAKGVQENLGESASEKTYYLEGWEGRSSLPEPAVGFVKSQHLVAARTFVFRDKQYKQNARNFLVSGQLAHLLLEKTKSSVQLTPMTFDAV